MDCWKDFKYLRVFMTFLSIHLANWTRRKCESGNGARHRSGFLNFVRNFWAILQNERRISIDLQQCASKKVLVKIAFQSDPKTLSVWQKLEIESNRFASAEPLHIDHNLRISNRHQMRSHLIHLRASLGIVATLSLQIVVSLLVILVAKWQWMRYSERVTLIYF